MKSNVFNLDNFNIFSDENNYYFFRALNSADNNDLTNGIITDSNGNIVKIRTDLERYDGDALYSSDDEISLEQMVNHIKMYQRKDTNCISLTSNANTALTYGRGNYSDKYILVKVPKEEIGKRVYQAGLYMLEKVEKLINEKYENNELDDTQKYFINAINNAKTNGDLEKIKRMLPKEFVQENDKYQGGLEFNFTNSINFISLNDEQNFEKNKVVMKLDMLNKQLLKGISNKFLISTIGNAFSSMELIHYKEITKEEIIELPKELADIFGLVQQLPNNLENLNELKLELINIASSVKLKGILNYQDFSLAEKEFTLDKMYELTKGKVDYKTAYNMYKKSFYLCKSKIRNHNSILILNELINNNPKYKPILDYMKDHTFGIEPEITTRLSKNFIKVSESVSLDFRGDEKFLFEFINGLSIENQYRVMQNPTGTLKNLLEYFIYENDYVMQLSKEQWYANSIIDMLDLSRFEVKAKLNITQRNDIINKLIQNGFYKKYKNLQQKGYNNKDLVNILFTQLIRKTEEADLKDLFTLEELEDFIGYNRIKDTNLKLKTYQKIAVDNVDRLFFDKQFAAAILPTGAGKSFVALAEMYKYRNGNILYLAPNNEILNQLKNHVKYVYHPEEHISEKLSKVVKRKFPNIIFDTYQHLSKESADDIRKKQYDLIVFDELHRTGAAEWMKYVEELINNQSSDTKVLGITATPERDVDYRNMTNYWASKLGYSEEEIDRNMHLAINMDIIEGIKSGYIINPKVVCCEYSLISDGTYDEMKITIDDLKSKNMSQEVISKYEKSRREVENSYGIEKILKDNLKEDGKYIVFLPITRKDNVDYEDVDGNAIDKKQSEGIIKDYQVLMKQYFYSSKYFEKNDEMLKKIYDKIINNVNLSLEEIKFLNKEKNNILLLSNIKIASQPSALSTKNSIIADEIIDKMNWQRYDKQTLSKILNRLMENEVNDYSMLGSYGSYKNGQNLANFNNDKSHKKKFMFVMNKLNEGVHVNDIDGIIWMRPLDENSRILYLQQLGRCIYPVSRGKDFKTPLVIDLVNNTLNVDLYKNIDNVESDLMTISFIKEWISINGRYPSLNSRDKNEQTLSLRLEMINRKYNKYVFDEKLLIGLDKERKNKIKEIIDVGCNIDLWHQEKLTINKEKTHIKVLIKDNLTDFIELSAVSKNFLELKQKIEEIDLNSFSIIDWVQELKTYCEEYKEWPKERSDKITKTGEKTSYQLAAWLRTSGYNRNEFKYNHVIINGKPIKEIIDELNDKYGYIKLRSDESVIKYVQELKLYCEEYKEWPKKRSDKITKTGTKTSNQLAAWLRTSGYNRNEFKYNHVIINGKPIKEIIDELNDKYGYIKLRSDESVIKYVQELKLYCEEYKEWPKKRSDKITKTGTKTSNQLETWLRNLGYYKNEFKYNDVVINGQPIKEIIDELYEKCYIKKKEESVIKYVQELKLYCEEYKEWPKDHSNKITKTGTKTSNQLATWLWRSGYYKNEFKYNDVVINGQPIKEIIDELYEKCYIKKKEESVIKYVQELKLYCEEYKEWPKQRSDKITKTGTKTSNQLAAWLGHSGYNRNEFKYNDVIINGKLIKEIIDELAYKYKKGIKTFKDAEEKFEEGSRFNKVVKDNRKVKEKNDGKVY